MGASFLGVLASFGGASLAYVWPSRRGRFGGVLAVGDEAAVLAQIRAQRQPFQYPAGRLYLVEYDPADDRDGAYVELTSGARLMALHWVCPHLGCKVPWCESSQWFECPCHGSRYNRWGEFRRQPAPRGMDRFACWVEAGQLVVDTSSLVEGPSRTVNSLNQPPEGPSCV
jgi:cytochrome b6-f complex iron-sulfur subunit